MFQTIILIRRDGEKDDLYYDYALVYVQENLSQKYGSFNPGMILTGIDQMMCGTDSNGTEQSDGTGVDVTLTGFPGGVGLNPYPGTSQGQLYNFNEYIYTTTTDRQNGISGGVSYITSVYNGNKTDIAFGIHTSRADGAVSGKDYMARGVLITRPILQFLLNNPNLEKQI